MFDKILIANRGEIACRIMRTARRMGIKTVAVYSDADATGLHVQMADEAIGIGPAPSAQSYLLVDRIVEACRKSGAQAVHPGFGFLSEKPVLPEALAAAGVTFIGPPPSAIAAMGDKIESKKIAEAAGVNGVPGHLADIATVDEAMAIAKRIGFPVMIKASAGGGGKGMRVARSEGEVKEGYTLAKSEAKSSFGDDRVFMEKFVDQPRHIEIQVLADGHGTVLYLGERECSIQRRHQKVIEEAPSPFIDAATRKAMGEQAVALARRVGYRSAGTVEFIVDGARNFYFLEMNTRLQVEHPVTELITGLDLVEWMIRIAAGDKLPFTQDDIKLNGWALEARVYAEDPVRGFVPSTGRLVRYIEPPVEGGVRRNGLPDPAGAGVRCDSGVAEGSEISMFYDPMIAKLCAWGPDRGSAIDRLRGALDGYVIRGVTHNASFVSTLLDTARFRSGNITTKFIEEEFKDGFQPRRPDDRQAIHFATVATFLQHAHDTRDAKISGQLAGHEAKVPSRYVAMIADRSLALEVVGEPGGVAVSIDGVRRVVAGHWKIGDALFRGTVDGLPFIAQVQRQGLGFRLFHDGMDVLVKVLTPRAAELSTLMPVKLPPDMSRFLLSPMPGLLLRLEVAEGEDVKAGQALAVVEAMKMENVLRAERDGTVAKLHAKPGDSLAVDQAILEFVVVAPEAKPANGKGANGKGGA